MTHAPATLLAAMIDGTLSSDDEQALMDAARHDPAVMADLLDLLEADAIFRWEARAAAKVRIETRRPPRPLPQGEHPRTVGVSAVAAALLLATAAIAIYLFALTPDPRPLIPDAFPLATVLGTSPGSTLIANDTIVNPGTEFTRGETSLDTGSAEFRLDNGVNVRLTGTTRLIVHDPMRATLAAGAARFECPADAVGFQVAVPGGRIIDQGTAFDVEIDASGHARVGVIEGRVDLRSTASTEPVSLGEGELGVLYADGALARGIPLPPPIVTYDLAPLPTSPAGKPSTGTHVDRINRPAAVIDDPAIPDGDWTVSLWFRRQSPQLDPHTVYLAAVGNRTSIDPGWSIVIGSGRGELGGRLVVRLSSGAQVAAATGPVITDTRWHHVAMVYDRAAGRVRGFLDGSANAWTPGGGGAQTDRVSPPLSTDFSEPLRLGLIADNVGAGQPPVPIRLRDVQVFHHALSPLQLRAAYRPHGDAATHHATDDPTYPPPVSPSLSEGDLQR